MFTNLISTYFLILFNQLFNIERQKSRNENMKKRKSTETFLVEVEMFSNLKSHSLKLFYPCIT